MADRMSILLIGGYIGALALGAYELQRVPSVPGSIPGKAVEPLPPLEVPPDVIKNIAVFDAIIERPLFSRERLPEVATQSPGPPKRLAQSDEIEGMRLTAVLKGPDSLTVLLEERSGQTRVLHQGDQLGKWRIEENPERDLSSQIEILMPDAETGPSKPDVVKYRQMLLAAGTVK